MDDKQALISPCGKYRYWLSRTWDRSLGVMPFVMLNPSTADADIDDPTIRRCMGFARREGFGGINVMNLYALRSTDPKKLFSGEYSPYGEDNFKWQQALLESSVPFVVCAWGANANFSVAEAFRKRAKALRKPLMCLGSTKAGFPRHPLYVRADQPLEPFGSPHE